jgi:hypothetical protein
MWLSRSQRWKLTPICFLLILCAGLVSQAQPRVNGEIQDVRPAPPEFEEDEDPELAKRRLETIFGWFYRAWGIFGILQLMVGMACFGYTTWFVSRGSGPFAAATLMLVVPIPFWMGVLGTVDRLAAAFSTYAGGIRPVPRYIIADMMGSAFHYTTLGLFLMTPSYLVATIGSSRRALQASRDTARRQEPAPQSTAE